MCVGVDSVGPRLEQLNNDPMTMFECYQFVTRGLTILTAGSLPASLSSSSSSSSSRVSCLADAERMF